MSWSWLSVSSLVTRSALKPPVTRLYPIERRTPYAKTRGHILFVVDNCNFCTICAHKCPTRAIVANKKEKTWAIDHSLCILCGNCVEDCREGCITLSDQPCPPMRAKEVLQFRKEHDTPSA
ncbi:4Fe-4S binding protein [Imhoffiella purpurea]|uniref:Energy-conserving hydrogenase (Ferredoxin), subunit F n=1 Tax=Imhoffiella purpurea TaxID=1249627 RepID=W9VB69_9GAMM|nr:4Fe-4S binding protein [Imhoffiella purpurea]EXJ16689.1 Energy-conserving hydrogenase (ferredoxin), subunit F [Imhoffiella purpurea]